MDTLLSLSVAELAFTCGVKMFRVVKALATKSPGVLHAVLYAVLYGVFTGLYGTCVELYYSVVCMLSCPGVCTLPSQDGNVNIRKTKKLGDKPDDTTHTFVASGACHDHHGFILIDRVENVDTECIICYETTTSPLKTFCCKRLICRTCAFGLEAYKHACPMCRSDFDVHVDENTLRLKAQCKYAGIGCSWVGTLKEGVDHIERECPFVEPTTVDTAAHGFQHHKTVEATTKEWQYEELYDAKQEFLLSELNNVEVDGNEDDEDDSDMPERATESIGQMKQCVKNTEPFDDSAVKMERMKNIENVVGEEVLAIITANKHTKLCAAAHSMVKIHFPELKDDPDPAKRQEVMSNHHKEQDGGGGVGSDGVEHGSGGGGHSSGDSGGGGGNDGDGHNSDGDGDRHSGGDSGSRGGSDGDGHDGGDSGGGGDRHGGRDSGGGGSGSDGDGHGDGDRHGDGGGGSGKDKGTSEDKSDEGGGGAEDSSEGSGSGSSSMQGSYPERINSPYHNQAHDLRDVSTVNSEDAPSLRKNDVRTFLKMASVSHAMMHASGQSQNEPQTSSSQPPTCSSDSSPVAARRHKRKKRKRRGQIRAPGSRSRQWNTPPLVSKNYASRYQLSETSNQPSAENLSVTLPTPVLNQKNPSETTELVVSQPGIKVPKQEERLVFGHLSNSMQNLRAPERNLSLYSSSAVHRPQRVLGYPNEDRVSNGSPHQPTAEEQENNSAFVFCGPSGRGLTPAKLRSGSVGSTVHHFGLPSPTAFIPAVLREELSRAPIPVYFKNSSSISGWSLLNYSVECGKTGNLNGFFMILLSLIKCQLAFLSHTPIIIGPEMVRIGVEGKSVLLNVCDSNDTLSGFYQMLVDALLLFRSSIKQSHFRHMITENCMCVLDSLLSAAQTHRTLDVICTLLLSNLN